MRHEKYQKDKDWKCSLGSWPIASNLPLFSIVTMEGGIVGQEAQEVVSSFKSFHTLNVFSLANIIFCRWKVWSGDSKLQSWRWAIEFSITNLFKEMSIFKCPQEHPWYYSQSKTIWHSSTTDTKGCSGGAPTYAPHQYFPPQFIFPHPLATHPLTQVNPLLYIFAKVTWWMII